MGYLDSYRLSRFEMDCRSVTEFARINRASTAPAQYRLNDVHQDPRVHGVALDPS